MRLSEPLFLAAAVALHAALPVIALVVPHSERPLVARGIHGDDQIEIDLTPVEPLPPRETPAERAAIDERRPDIKPEARVASRDPSVSPGEIAPSPTSTANPEAQPAPAPSGPPSGDTFDPIAPEGPPGPGGVVLGPGLSGRPAWSLPGVLPQATAPAPAPTVPPPPKAVDKDIAGVVLRKEQAKKDKALGLDLPAAGTVASAIKVAVQGGDTPNEGRATFEVRLSPSGQVVGVRVVSSSAGTSAIWDRAANAVRARLAGRALTMTSAYAAGATVYVDVTSAILMPDGSKTGGIQQQGAGASFDVSNLGAKPSRVIRTNFRVVAAK